MKLSAKSKEERYKTRRRKSPATTDTRTIVDPLTRMGDDVQIEPETEAAYKRG